MLVFIVSDDPVSMFSCKEEGLSTVSGFEENFKVSRTTEAIKQNQTIDFKSIFIMGTGSSAIEKTKQLGNQYFADGNYKEALNSYSKALEYDKNNQYLLSNRSVCYLKLGNIQNALLDALACVVSAPTWNKSYYRLSSALKACHLYSEALQAAEISYSILEDSLVYNLCEELKPLIKIKGRFTLFI